MKIQGKIQKWGNGLALRIAGVMRDIPGFREGNEVEIEVNEQGFVVRKVVARKKKLKLFSERELLAGITGKTAHHELVAEPRASEVGE